MIKKGLKIIVKLLTAFLFLLSIVLLVMGAISAKKGEPLNLFGYSYSVIATDSMDPTIKVGDSIIYKRVDYNSIVKDDIICFYRDLKNDGIMDTVCHRVFEVTNEGLITKGDNHLAPIDDEKVTEDIFIGKVLKYGNVGIGMIALNYKNYVFACIFIIFFYLIISQLINIFKIKKESELEQINKEKLLEKEKLREELLEEIKANQKE